MVTEYISKAWKVYKKNALSFIAAELIPNVITFLFVALGAAIFLGSVLSGLNFDVLKSYDPNLIKDYVLSLIKDEQFLSYLGFGLIGFVCLAAVGMFISTYLSIGQVGMAYESLRQRTSLKTMFMVSRKFGFRWIWTNLLLIAFLLIAFIPLLIATFFTLGVVPFFIIPFFVLIAPSMVVDNFSSLQSIKNSFRTAKRNYWNLFLLFLIYVGIIFGASFIGLFFGLFPLIGELINMGISLFLSFALIPMMRISFVNFYLRNRKGIRKEI